MASSSFYLSARQRADIAARRRSLGWRLEIPTWLLIASVYGGWFAGVFFWRDLGPWLGTPWLIWFTTWYMSLQHELIHGHPTRKPWLNQLFGMLPLAVWYPYGLYRDTHLQHHRNEHLTLPGDDPEAYYFSRARWETLSPAMKTAVRLRNTLPGRMLTGPLLDILSTLTGALLAVLRGEWRTVSMWLVHGALLAMLLGWMAQRGLSPLYFILAVSYPALSLTKVRSFFEHRAERLPQARSTLNEAGVVWRLLFLNLNYHLVHHDLPGVPWYALRQVYVADREVYIQRSDGFVVKGYRQWFRDHTRVPVDVEAHPFATGTTAAQPARSDYDYQQETP
ncbi:fatty acid desaturase [Rahnella sp. BIGb0236]|uniref:fatty acid desaturase n=1 Tax=Rahnella sp. BIGb0236 TaxID=2485117 RepID=UPI0010602825|nr:fatty acid desaturase [Rahnella sp. BIGb0236]TDS97101.1 fatty acid desaturase [Rahnella sp. BIGb0236]